MVLWDNKKREEFKMNLENRILNIMKKGLPTRFTIPLINFVLICRVTIKRGFEAEQ